MFRVDVGEWWFGAIYEDYYKYFLRAGTDVMPCMLRMTDRERESRDLQSSFDVVRLNKNKWLSYCHVNGRLPFSLQKSTPPTRAKRRAPFSRIFGWFCRELYQVHMWTAAACCSSCKTNDVAHRLETLPRNVSLSAELVS